MVISKSKTKLILIIIAVCIALITVLSIVVYNAGKLKRAIKAMDTDDKSTVTRVLSLADDNADIYLDVAKAYADDDRLSDAVPILWHILQNIDSDCKEAKKMLTDHYGEDDMSQQVSAAKRIATEFEVASEFKGVGYGGQNGIYCEDFGGFVRYKLSSARALQFSAATGGVYYLDAADRCVKFISRDGSRIELVKKGVSEFVFFQSHVYAIMQDGTISAPNEIKLADGEIATMLHVFDSQVLCSVYDSNYNFLRTEKLN